MVAFHIRNIPPELYERLRERARQEGRSVNAEVLSILERELSRLSPEEFERRLRDLHRRIRLTPDAPTPEQLIREDRDSH
jgi:plasmid stability protein